MQLMRAQYTEVMRQTAIDGAMLIATFAPLALSQVVAAPVVAVATGVTGSRSNGYRRRGDTRHRRGDRGRRRRCSHTFPIGWSGTSQGVQTITSMTVPRSALGEAFSTHVLGEGQIIFLRSSLPLGPVNVWSFTPVGF